MADTNYPVNHPLAVKQWSKILLREALKETQISRFIGGVNDTSSLIVLKNELQKNKGDRITYGLRMQLSGAGVQGDATLEGNEEALTTYSDNIFIDQLRHAVRSNGRMSEQRVTFDLREEAKTALADWYADRMDTSFFNQVCGMSSITDTRYTGNNTAVAPSSGRIVYAGSHTTEASVAGSSSAVFSLDLIDKAVEAAKVASPLIRPFKIMGKEKYVAFLHPFQVTSLRTTVSASAVTWYDIQKAAIQGGDISKNPIYTGALGEYNGVILHESTRIPSAVANSRRAVLCGAQAATLAFGDNFNQNPAWTEEKFDYGNKLGVSGSIIFGLKKNVFNSTDFGTIVIPTYAVASAS